MQENKNNIYNTIFEYIVLPIFVLFIGLIIEYKTNLFQNVVEPNMKTGKSDLKSREKDIEQMMDSIQQNIFNDGYSIFNEKEIYKFKSDARVYHEIIKDKIRSSRKIKDGQIYRTDDSIYIKLIGLNRVEFWSSDLYNEIATIRSGKFYKMGTMNDEYGSILNFIVSDNLKNDYPFDQLSIRISNIDKTCKIVGYFHKSEEDKFLKSKKRLIDDYENNILFWRKLFREEN